MNKRQRIFEKYNGLCAYSGTALEPDWQVDHVNPIIRNKDGSCMFPNADKEDNMAPCQRVINHYKGNWTLQEFRSYMLTLHERLAKLPVTPKVQKSIRRKEYMLKVAAYFDVTPENPWNGVFYFEKKEEK